MHRRIALLLALAFAPVLSAKSLHWRTFDVTAHLDAGGVLHVREQQGIVFDGDWNGGERRFNVRTGQSLQVQRMFRLENGQDVPMTRGDLSQVDHWDFYGADVIRWRSRKPSDPPFQNQEITYAIEYTLAGILQGSGKDFRLDHDFAFPARDGVIENFSLRLDADPVWRGLPNPLIREQQNIPPGQGVVVTAALTYTGSGSPSGVRETLSPTDAAAIVALLLLGGALVVWKFYSDEAGKGRFAPLPVSIVDRPWLERHVFTMPAEAVGYAWDEEIGAPEVGAVIARMEQEKKLKTWTTDKVLHLQLLVDVHALPPNEKYLIDALLVGNGNTTDTDQIRAYYKSTGFQPAKLVKPMVDESLANVPEWTQKSAGLRPGEMFLLIAALFAGWWTFALAKPVHFILIIGVVLTIVSLIVAFWSRRRVDLPPVAPMIAAGTLLVDAAAGVLLGISAGIGLISAVAVALTGLLVTACILLISRSREAPAKMEFRRKLAAARQFFEAQLRTAHPNLEDAWYPYLVALGLGASVDRWFSNFSGTTATAFAGSSSSFGSSSSGSSSGGWSGGGGAFGGAGASGSWAAMSAIAAGVAAPSSSGGGGGGGGSSGGGGGGGW